MFRFGRADIKNLETGEINVGGVNEFSVTTIAQATKWIEEQIPDMETDTRKVDTVYLVHVINNKSDDNLQNADDRLLGYYSKYSNKWHFIDRAAHNQERIGN